MARYSSAKALPWWSFALFGGVATIWLGKANVAALLGLPPADAPEFEMAPRWLLYTATALAFLPGALVGAGLGWFIIRPVNVVLGMFFRGFNRVFDCRHDDLRPERWPASCA